LGGRVTLVVWPICFLRWASSRTMRSGFRFCRLREPKRGKRLDCPAQLDCPCHRGKRLEMSPQNDSWFFGVCARFSSPISGCNKKALAGTGQSARQGGIGNREMGNEITLTSQRLAAVEFSFSHFAGGLSDSGNPKTLSFESWVLSVAWTVEFTLALVFSGPNFTGRSAGKSWRVSPAMEL